MASYLFSEPFYTLSDFDRLFDEAFKSRTDGQQNQGNGQVQRRAGATEGSRVFRPR